MIRFTIRQQINAVGNGFVMHFRAIIEIWGRGKKKKERKKNQLPAEDERGKKKLYYKALMNILV